MLTIVVLVVAGFLAGVINALAGGGGLVAFPAMLQFAGLDPITANASSAVALFPGGWMSAWAYRRNILGITEVPVRMIMVVSMIGGLVGALLLLYTPTRFFANLVPWLMLFATALFAIGSVAPLHVMQRMKLGHVSGMVAMFVTAIYGGYFGGGIGFLMLSAFTLYGMRDINAMNGLKVVLVGMLSFVALATFIYYDVVAWRETLPMLLGCLVGGYAGAHYGKRLDQRLLRTLIILFGAGMTAYFFWRGV